MSVQLLVDELKLHEDSKGLPWKDLDKLEDRRKAPRLDEFPLKGFINRAEAMKDMLEYLQSFEQRYTNWTPPMGVVHGGPGTGKSKFLSILAGSDDIAKEISDSTSLQLYTKIRGKLEGYIPLVVTFGSFSNLGPDENDPMVALAIRTLFS